MAPTTLVVIGESALGRALELILSQGGIDIRLVQKPPASTGKQLEVDCIATSLGTAFVYIESESQILPASIGTSFRLSVCIINASRLGRDNLFRIQTETAFPKKTVFVLAHNAEEAAEFVVSLVNKLSDKNAMDNARKMILQGSSEAFVDPKSYAFKIAELGLPQIAKNESQVLLESAGSWIELARMRDANEIASRSPLSDRDAHIVAEVLGLEPGKVEMQYDQPMTSDNMIYPGDLTTSSTGIFRLL